MSALAACEKGLRTAEKWPFGAVVGGLVALVALFHLLTLPNSLGWYGDSCQYLLHAENILAGRPYADTGYIHNPERYKAPVAYPIGFPLLLAPVIALFGMNVQAIQWLLVGVWAATLIAFAYLFRNELPRQWVYGLVLVIGLQPYLWALKMEPLSDLPFLLFAVISLAWYDRASEAEREGMRQTKAWGLAVGAGLAATYAVATRPIAIVLVPAFLLATLVQDRRLTRSFVVTTLTIVLVIGAFALLVDLNAGARVVQSDRVGSGAGEGSGSGYGALVQIAIIERFNDLPRHVLERIVDYARATFVFWHVPQPWGGVVKNVLMGLSLLPISVGLWSRRDRFGVIEAFAVSYMLSLLPWSFSNVRYFAPLIPFYYFYLFVGLRWLLPAGGVNQRALGRVALLVTITALVAVYAFQYASSIGRAGHQTELSEIVSDPVIAYLREQSLPSAVIITNGDPRSLAFFTRRGAAVAPEEAGRWGAFAERAGASYALVAGDQRDAVRQALPPSMFRLVASSEERDLYRVHPHTKPGVPEGEGRPDT